jgi:hypothetical protein
MGLLFGLGGGVTVILSAPVSALGKTGSFQLTVKGAGHAVLREG